jgi:very-short-patch-repair endonuclease
VIVELDAFETHGTTFAFERDRRRDLALEAAGWTVVRITARQLAEEPKRVRRHLARLLDR